MKGIRRAEGNLSVVSGEEFQRIIRNIKSGKMKTSEIKTYYKYLDGKTIYGDLQSVDEMTRAGYLNGQHLCKEKTDAQRIFVEQITKRSSNCSYYGKETEQYIKSDSFSDAMKKCILFTISKDDGAKEAREKIEEVPNINDLSLKALKIIYSALKRSKDSDFLGAFIQYMFVLDGKGPISFIKEKYLNNPQRIAMSFLDHLGIDLYIRKIDPLETEEEKKKRERKEAKRKPNEIIEYGLLIEYIMAIYRMYCKYLPELSESFSTFVNGCGFRSHEDFVIKYKLFVNSIPINEEEIQYIPTDETFIDEGERQNQEYIKRTFARARRSLSSEKKPLESVIKKYVYGINLSKNNKN